MESTEVYVEGKLSDAAKSCRTQQPPEVENGFVISVQACKNLGANNKIPDIVVETWYKNILDTVVEIR